jgi:hypothetical protein
MGLPLEQLLPIKWSHLIGRSCLPFIELEQILQQWAFARPQHRHTVPALALFAGGGEKIMKVHGGCHCGAIRFEAEVDPDKTMMCHCTDCQALSSTAFRVNVPTAAADFRLLQGTPKEYVKIGSSGARRAQGFCADCGSQIYATGAEHPREVYMLRTGVIEERQRLVPKGQIWRQSALGWLGDWPGIPAKPQG